LVCPRCRLGVESQGPLTHSGPLKRCPEHGLALVEPHALLEAEEDPLLGTTLAGRFTVLARLGSGSMGSVYRARQEAVGRDVALKVLRRDRAYDAEAKARFEREARATSALVSAHTVTVFDFGEADDGSWFLAMEMLYGETLGERLRRVKRLTPEQAVHIARQTLSSLAEAHAKGIVHRDLKPDNLFLVTGRARNGGDLCKVLDFGIAKLMHEDLLLDQLETQSGTVFGTPRYMSPEQAQGKSLDPRSDLYAVGLLLYQMLVGRPPFVDADAVVVMARHIKDEPPSFAELAPDALIPPLLEDVVRRALAKDPARRPQSAEQLALELERAMSDGAAAQSGQHFTSWGGPSSDLVPSARAIDRRVPWKLGLAALISVAGAAVIGFALQRDRAPAATAVVRRAAPAVAPPPPALSVSTVPSAHATLPDGGAQNVGPSGQRGAARPKPSSNGVRVPAFSAEREP
jgi:serine/threonine-protein kinase